MSNALSGTPLPQSITDFSSDLDESQNWSLRKVGGTHAPIPPVATPLETEVTTLSSLTLVLNILLRYRLSYEAGSLYSIVQCCSIDLSLIHI